MSLKPMVKGLFRLITWPLAVLFYLMARLGNQDGVFQAFSQFISLFPGKTGSYLRAAFYSRVCPATSDEIVIGFLTLLSHRDTTIKRGVYIGPQCNIGKCTIDEDTLLGSGVHILSGKHQHDFDDPETPIQQQGGYFEKITIGKDCWLGNKSLVMASVPPHTVIAAGSVLSQSPETPGNILAGNPAKIVKKRFN